MRERCTVCGSLLPSEGTIVGDGDGSGRMFAHLACYKFREAMWELLSVLPREEWERRTALLELRGLYISDRRHPDAG